MASDECTTNDHHHDMTQIKDLKFYDDDDEINSKNVKLISRVEGEASPLFIHLDNQRTRLN